MESTPGVAANGNRAMVEKYNAFEQIIAIHPNPSNQYFNISGVNFPNANIQIFDMQHNLVQSINNYEISRSVAIDKLSAGMYTIKLKSPDGSFNYLKLVVCR